LAEASYKRQIANAQQRSIENRDGRRTRSVCDLVGSDADFAVRRCSYTISIQLGEASKRSIAWRWKLRSLALSTKIARLDIVLYPDLSQANKEYRYPRQQHGDMLLPREHFLRPLQLHHNIPFYDERSIHKKIGLHLVHDLLISFTRPVFV